MTWVSATSFFEVQAEFATSMTLVADTPDEAVEALKSEFPGCTLLSVQVRNSEE